MKMWMKYVFTIALTCCCLGTLQASWESDSINPSVERQRIEQIITDDEGVYVLIDGFWLGSQGIQATPEEILVLEDGEWIPLQEAIRSDNYYVWQCRKCRAWHSEARSSCYRCSTARKG